MGKMESRPEIGFDCSRKIYAASDSNRAIHSVCCLRSLSDCRMDRHHPHSRLRRRWHGYLCTCVLSSAVLGIFCDCDCRRVKTLTTLSETADSMIGKQVRFIAFYGAMER